MITREEYQARRLELAKCLPADCVAIIPAACELVRNGDAHYRFRQASNFYYLTGFNEPDALLVITSGPQSESILFNRPRDLAQEQWNGKRLGQENARDILGVTQAFNINMLENELPELLAGKQAIYYTLGQSVFWDKHLLQAWQTVKGQIRKGIRAPEAFCDIEPIISEMRLFKSEAEFTLMREAARITVNAHQQAMRACKHLKYEYELEAEILYAFFRQGCRSAAYDSIVAGGENACILHYTENNQSLKSGDLVLIDAGGEYESYAADVTRTFPVSGKYSAEQRLIYNLVLNAQRAGIEMIRPGCVWGDIQQAIVGVLTTGLVELGLLHGNVNDLIAKEAYRPFYMHSSGHWLGLDVHDCGRYKVDNHWRELQSGMALTVEPGIYISPHMENVDRRWWGIGVRIEDDIYVTANGYENLTANLAVEIDDIEALMRD